MAAMGPPGGGRNVISRRLQSRFNLINMTFPQESQIKRIFGTMIAQKLQDFDEEVKPLGDMMTKVGVVGGWGHCSVCAASPVWWEGGATARCVLPPLCGGRVGPLLGVCRLPCVVGGQGHCSVCAASPVWWEGGATAPCVPPPLCGGRVGPLLGVCRLPCVVGGWGHCSVCAASPVWWEGGATAPCVPPPLCGGVSAAVPFAAQATVEVYNTISTSMLPTPTKIHYLFNLRDISKVRCVEGKDRMCVIVECVHHMCSFICVRVGGWVVWWVGLYA